MVVQGHRCWYHWKARQQCLLWYVCKYVSICNHSVVVPTALVKSNCYLLYLFGKLNVDDDRLRSPNLEMSGPSLHSMFRWSLCYSTAFSCLRRAIYSLVISLRPSVVSVFHSTRPEISDVELAESTVGYSRAGPCKVLYRSIQVTAPSDFLLLGAVYYYYYYYYLRRGCAASPCCDSAQLCAAWNFTCPIILTTATRSNPALNPPVVLQGIRKSGNDYEDVI